MRFSSLLSLLRPVGPVVVGVSLGFTLSLLSVTWVEEPCGPGHGSFREGGLEQHQHQGGQGNAARKPNSVSGGLGTEPEQSWEPRVLPYKPLNPGKVTKKTIRYLWGRGTGEVGEDGSRTQTVFQRGLGCLLRVTSEPPFVLGIKCRDAYEQPFVNAGVDQQLV